MKNKIIAFILTLFVVIDASFIVLAMNITPLTIKRDTFVYEYGNEISKNAADYVNANESVLSQVTLDFSEVKDAVGLYKASATYMDIPYYFYIKVEDTTKPVVTLKSVTYNVAVGESVKAIDLIDTVEDKSDIIAYFKSDSDTKETSKSYKTKGSYVENIIVEDNSGNQSASLRVKIVVGQTGNNPTLSGIDNIEVLVDSKFEPLKGVKASDGNGNDITDSIKILKNNVNTAKTGTYEVIYSVTNEYNMTLQRSRRVTVVDSEKVNSNVD